MEFRGCSFALVTMIMFVGAIPPGTSAQLLGQIVISGTVPCSQGTTITTGTTVPVFPNALVQLKCGGNTIAGTTTNVDGAFTIILSPLTTLLSTLLTGCTVVVETPLSTCNATLPGTGILQSPLQLLSGGVLGGILGGIVNLIPTIFSYIENIV